MRAATGACAAGNEADLCSGFAGNANPPARSDNPVLAYGSWLAETPADWPEAAWEAARRAFIDTIAVAVPGAAEPVTRKVFDTVKGWGQGPSTAILQGARLPAPWAALVNGTAAHALDFADTFDPAKAPASALLGPAVLALAEQEGSGGRAAEVRVSERAIRQERSILRAWSRPANCLVL